MAYTLRDITNKMYSKRGQCDDDEGQEYYYQAQAKKFKDIVRTLDIVDEMKWLKKRSYYFNEKDVDFWCDILEKYSDSEMDHLRRAELDVNEVSDIFVVKLYEGIVNTFIHAEVTGEQLEEVMVKLDNRIDYPVRKKRVMIHSMLDDLDEQIKDNCFEFLSASDKYEWLNKFQSALHIFIKDWIGYFDVIHRMRQQEYRDNMANLETENPEEFKMLMLFNGDITNELYRQLDEDNEYYDIQREFEKKYKSMNEVTDAKSQKQPYFTKLQAELAELNKKMMERQNMICKQVIDKSYPQFKQALYDKAEQILYSKRMSSKELLESVTKKNEERVENKVSEGE